MSNCVGTWKLAASENFDDLMKQLGVGLLTRKVGNNTKPTVKLTVDGDNWTMATESTFKNHVVKFKLNEEFDGETMDGRSVKTTFTLDGDKLVQTERDKDNNITCVITRSVNDKGELIAIAKAGEIVSTRTYAKQ